MNENEKAQLRSILDKHLPECEAERYYNRIVAYASGKNPTIKGIKAAVEMYFDLDMGQLEGIGRTKMLATARQIAMYVCYTSMDTSLPKVGKYFGGRDHTTVLHAINRVKNDKHMLAIANNIKASLIENKPTEYISNHRLREMIAMDGVDYRLTGNA